MGMAITAAIGLLLLVLPQGASADFAGRFPMYLFSDWRYWGFLALYILVTVKVIQWTLRYAPGAKERVAQFPAHYVSTSAVLIFTNALVYQIFHHLEHVTQIFQWWYMGLPPPKAKGIIFFADLEWNHFIFDMGYFILLMIGTMVFLRTWWHSGQKLGKVGAFLLIGMNSVQGWHAIEHTYRIMHHVQLGCEPCAGIVDQITGIPLIPLHFWFNVLALTFPLMIYFWFGMHRKAMGILKRTFGKKEKQMKIVMA